MRRRRRAAGEEPGQEGGVVPGLVDQRLRVLTERGGERQVDLQRAVGEEVVAGHVGARRRHRPAGGQEVVDRAGDVRRGLDQAPDRLLRDEQLAAEELGRPRLGVDVVGEQEAGADRAHVLVVDGAERLAVGALVGDLRLVGHAREGDDVVAADDDLVGDVRRARLERVEVVADLLDDRVRECRRAWARVPGVVGGRDTGAVLDPHDRAVDAEVAPAGERGQPAHDVGRTGRAVGRDEPRLVDEEERIGRRAHRRRCSGGSVGDAGAGRAGAKVGRPEALYLEHVRVEGVTREVGDLHGVVAGLALRDEGDVLVLVAAVVGDAAQRVGAERDRVQRQVLQVLGRQVLCGAVEVEARVRQLRVRERDVAARAATKPRRLRTGDGKVVVGALRDVAEGQLHARAVGADRDAEVVDVAAEQMRDIEPAALEDRSRRRVVVRVARRAEVVVEGLLDVDAHGPRQDGGGEVFDDDVGVDGVVAEPQARPDAPDELVALSDVDGRLPGERARPDLRLERAAALTVIQARRAGDVASALRQRRVDGDVALGVGAAGHGEVGAVGHLAALGGEVGERECGQIELRPVVGRLAQEQREEVVERQPDRLAADDHGGRLEEVGERHGGVARHVSERDDQVGERDAGEQTVVLVRLSERGRRAEAGDEARPDRVERDRVERGRGRELDEDRVERDRVERRVLHGGVRQPDRVERDRVQRDRVERGLGEDDRVERDRVQRNRVERHTANRGSDHRLAARVDDALSGLAGARAGEAVERVDGGAPLALVLRGRVRRLRVERDRVERQAPERQAGDRDRVERRRREVDRVERDTCQAGLLRGGQAEHVRERDRVQRDSFERRPREHCRPGARRVERQVGEEDAAESLVEQLAGQADRVERDRVERNRVERDRVERDRVQRRGLGTRAPLGQGRQRDPVDRDGLRAGVGSRRRGREVEGRVERLRLLLGHGLARRELRRVAARVGGRRGHHRAVWELLVVLELEVDQAVAEVVDEDRAEEVGALAVAAPVAGGAGEELDAVVLGVRRHPERARNVCDAPAGLGGVEHGEVLQLVRPRVAVGRLLVVAVVDVVVRGDPVAAEVDAEAHVDVDRVGADAVAGAVRDHDARRGRAVAGDGVAGDLVVVGAVQDADPLARRVDDGVADDLVPVGVVDDQHVGVVAVRDRVRRLRVLLVARVEADLVAGRAPGELDADVVRQDGVAVGTEADQVGLDAVVVRAVAVDPDGRPAVGRDDVAERAVVVSDAVVGRAGADVHAVAVAELAVAAERRPDQVADDRVAARPGVLDHHAGIPVTGDQVAFAGRAAADRVAAGTGAEEHPDVVLELRLPIECRPDPVSADDVARRVLAGDLDARALVAGDEVAEGRARAADRVAGGVAADQDAGVVRVLLGAVGARADAVADDLVAAGAGAGDDDARLALVAAQCDHVDVAARARVVADDGVLGAAADLDAGAVVGAVALAVGLEADQVAAQDGAVGARASDEHGLIPARPDQIARRLADRRRGAADQRPGAAALDDDAAIVAALGGPGRVAADVIPLDLGADRAVVHLDAMTAVVADDVARAGRRAADERVVRVDDLDAVAAVAGAVAEVVQADPVPLDLDAVGSFEEQDALVVVRDQVAGGRGRASDRRRVERGGRLVDGDADPRRALAARIDVADVGGAVRADPDRVALDRAAVRIVEVDAEVVAADQVAGARGGAADLRVDRAGEVDPGVVAALGGAGRVDADVVALDHQVGDAVAADAEPIVAGDDVAGARGCTADRRAVAVRDVDSVVVVAHCGGAVGREADQVAGDGVVVRVQGRARVAADLDAAGAVAGDDVARSRRGAAHGVVRPGLRERDAVLPVRDGRGAVAADSDVVPLDVVEARTGIDVHAVREVAGDHVARGRAGAADAIALAHDLNAVRVRQLRDPVGLDADQVAFDHVRVAAQHDAHRVVPGHHVPRSGGRAADLVPAADDEDAPGAVAQIGCSGRVGADVVALDGVSGAVELDAVGAGDGARRGGDHVARSGRRAANRGRCGSGDVNARADVGQRGRAVGGGPDVVALDDRARGSAIEEDAAAKPACYHVARPDGAPPDDGSRCPGNPHSHAGDLTGEGRCPRGVQPHVVALDHVARGQ